MDYLAEQDEINNRKPLDAETLSTLPIVKYQKRSDQTEEKDDDNQCVICYNQFEEGDIIAILPCAHKFHQEELWRWFEKQGTCPIDKMPVKQ